MLAYEFCQWLQTKGFGVLGTSIFDNFQPENPDNCICVYDTQPPSLPESSSLSVDNFGIQVLTRNDNKENARELLINIHLAFMGFGGEKLVPTSIFIVTETSIDTSPVGIGKDDKGRHEYSVNYILRTQSFNNEYRL